MTEFLRSGSLQLFRFYALRVSSPRAFTQRFEAQDMKPSSEQSFAIREGKLIDA